MFQGESAANAGWLNSWIKALKLVGTSGGSVIMPVYKRQKSQMQFAEREIASGFRVPIIKVFFDEDTELQDIWDQLRKAKIILRPDLPGTWLDFKITATAMIGKADGSPEQALQHLHEHAESSDHESDDAVEDSDMADASGRSGTEESLLSESA